MAFKLDFLTSISKASPPDPAVTYNMIYAGPGEQALPFAVDADYLATGLGILTLNGVDYPPGEWFFYGTNPVTKIWVVGFSALGSAFNAAGGVGTPFSIKYKPA